MSEKEVKDTLKSLNGQVRTLIWAVGIGVTASVFCYSLVRQQVEYEMRKHEKATHSGAVTAREMIILEKMLDKRFDQIDSRLNRIQREISTGK